MTLFNGTTPPPYAVFFGPDANCTLAICPIDASVYHYRPTLPGNSVFLAIFALAMLIHIFLGIRWRSWWFMICMVAGCLVEIVGYIGRIILYKNPWNFIGFMLQVVFITLGPVFYTAAIYVTLSKTVVYLNRDLSRIRPNLYYWIFIPTDVVCLVLQASGGALSTISSGSSQTGVDIALGGLSLQVASLFAFGTLFADYIIRYVRNTSSPPLESRMRLFLSFLFAATLLIFVRCLYRCYELSQGYQHSHLITNEGLFIGLEGVLIVVAVFCLCLGQPGFVWGQQDENHQHPKVNQSTSATPSDWSATENKAV